MATNFPVHGNFEVSIEEDILILKCQGPWNIEFFHMLHQDLISAVKQVNPSNYAVLLITAGEAIGTAEAMEYHINFLKQGNTKAVAINLACSDVPSSTENLCRIAYQAANLKHEFFLDNNKAMSWLKKQLT